MYVEKSRGKSKKIIVNMVEEYLMATIAIIKFVLILQKIILIDMVLILKLFFTLFLNIMYFPKILAVFFFILLVILCI